MTTTQTTQPTQHACTIDTPVGLLELRSNGKALTSIYFTDKASATATRGDLDSDPVLRETADQLNAYFAGERTDFDLPLAPHGTDFQERVWSALTEIPYAETWSYAELARHIGLPTAFRAVGAANGQNPLPIVIPCHRVVGANGKLVGYGGGMERKRHLLELEANVRVRRDFG
ncbi:MAG TPA: methylated-DNA--[protein]-cysteine S-methyltransferase [Actinopolymorphaceae bacterium]|nr:methylated-DNA--[protein]-cysteine S-methyltransferase [Actinopolymorphaceae bacterium]